MMHMYLYMYMYMQMSGRARILADPAHGPAADPRASDGARGQAAATRPTQRSYGRPPSHQIRPGRLSLEDSLWN